MYILVWIYSYASYDVALKLKINSFILKGNAKSIIDNSKQCDAYVHFCLFIVAMPHDIAPRLKINSCIQKEKCEIHHI
jgi:hypothetical protein